MNEMFHTLLLRVKAYVSTQMNEDATLKKQEESCSSDEMQPMLKTPQTERSKKNIAPLLYLIFSLLAVLTTVGWLHIHKYLNKQQIPSTPSLFDIPSLNPLLFSGISLIASSSGLVTIICLHNLIKQRLSVPEFKHNLVNLNISTALGLFLPLFEFTYALIPLLKQLRDHQNSILLHLFLTKQVILLVYTCLLNSLTSIFCTNSLSAEQNRNVKIKAVILAYLFILSFVYCGVLYQPSVLEHSADYLISESVSNLILLYSPYLLHFVSSTLVYSFEFDLVLVEGALRNNKEVDYLFEETFANI